MNLEDGKYYVLKFPDGELTVGRWVGYRGMGSEHFEIVGSDCPVHAREVEVVELLEFCVQHY